MGLMFADAAMKTKAPLVRRIIIALLDELIVSGGSPWVLWDWCIFN